MASLVVKVRRWGNSLGFRIPRSVARKAGIEEGETIHITLRPRNPVDELWGRWKGKGSLKDAMRELEALDREWR